MKNSSSILIRRGHPATVKAFAEWAELPEQTVWRAVREGRIPALRVGRRILLPADFVESAFEGKAGEEA